MEVYHFLWYDYVIFFLVIIVATGVGIYYGYIKPLIKKHQTPKQPKPDTQKKKRHRFSLGSKQLAEYLLGSHELKIFPIAMSLTGSYISGATIVGTPSEIYIYGTQYWTVLLPIVLMGFTVAFVYLPVFAALRLASSYEYLELRFNAKVRTAISCMFVMDELFFLPFLVYVPSIAFSQATGFDPIKTGCVACVICVVYTFLGGIRTVVATDALQIVIMFCSTLLIVLMGIYYGGGLTKIFTHANEGGRVIYRNFDTSPFARQTVFTVLFGGYSYWTAFNTINQTMIQRYMCLDQLSSMRKASLIFCFGVLVAVSISCMSGVLIFNEFGDCDPLSTGQVQTYDQLVILYVTKVFHGKFGLPGFFIAGIFGAGLSCLSVVLNSTATVIFQDICKGGFNMQFSERSGEICLKATVIILGCIALGLLTVVNKLGTLLGAAISLTSIAASTSFGVFTLGMLVPFSTTKGAYAGVAVSALLTGWVAIGTQVTSAEGKLHPTALPIYTFGCPNGTVLHKPPSIYDQSKIFPLYRLSYWWINPIGICTVLVVGSIVSLITGHKKLDDVDPQLISPAIHWVLPEIAFLNYGKSKANSKTISSSKPSTIMWVGRPPPTTIQSAFEPTATDATDGAKN